MAPSRRQAFLLSLLVLFLLSAPTHAQDLRLAPIRASTGGTALTLRWLTPAEPSARLMLQGPGLAQPRILPIPEGATRLPLTLPPDPGLYRLTWWSRIPRRSARAEAIGFAITQPPRIALAAPAEIAAGHPFPLLWQGPEAPGDRIVLLPEAAAPPAEAPVLQSWPISAGRPGQMTAPLQPGTYHLYYRLDAWSRLLGRKGLTVLPFRTWINAPGSVPAGLSVAIDWQAASAPGELRLVDESGRVLARLPADGPHPASLPAPAIPGAYRLQLWHAAWNQVTAEVALTVTPAADSAAPPAEPAPEPEPEPSP